MNYKKMIAGIIAAVGLVFITGCTSEKGDNIILEKGKVEIEGNISIIDDDIRKITQNNYKRKLVDPVIASINKERHGECNEHIQDCYPFSQVVGEKLKWGFRTIKGDVLVEPTFDKTYIDPLEQGYKVESKGEIRSYDINEREIGEIEYDKLLFVSTWEEGGIVSDEHTTSYIYKDKVSGIETSIKGIIGGSYDGVLVTGIFPGKKDNVKYTKTGIELGKEEDVQVIEETVVCVKGKDVFNIYMKDGTYLGWIPFGEDGVEISQLKKDIEERLYSSEGERNIIEAIHERKGEYLGEGIGKYMESEQWDIELFLYTLENFLTGEKTDEVYHNAIRIGKNRILGVTPRGIEILDNHFNLIRENNIGYYEKYYTVGDLIVGENIEGEDEVFNVYLDKEGAVIWKESMVSKKGEETMYQGAVEFYMKDSLNAVRRDWSFKAEDKKIMKLIDERIIPEVEEKQIGLFEKTEEKFIRLHGTNYIGIREEGDGFVIENRFAGSAYGGGHYSGFESEKIYAARDGEILDMEELMLPNWQEKAAEIIKKQWEKEEVKPREIEFDKVKIDFKDGDIYLIKNRYYWGSGDWALNVKLEDKDIENLVDKESLIYRTMRGEKCLEEK